MRIHASAFISKKVHFFPLSSGLPQDFLRFIEQLNELQADFICPQYNFDTTTPIGKVFITIIMTLAQFERELTAERTKNNFHARALRALQQSIDNIIKFISENPTLEDVQSIKENLLKAEAELKEIEEKKEILKIQRKTLSESALNTTNIQNYLKEAFGKFYRFTPYQRKVLLRNSIASITIHPNNVMKINFYAHSKEENEAKEVIRDLATACNPAVAGSDTVSSGCGGRI